ncbi:MAG TPA: amino acid adenylation domain-containing protein, partial [Gemmatimonadaceae bacterium]
MTRFPLGPGQHRLWFHSQLHPEAYTYNVPVMWRLRGPLDEAALEAAIRGVVLRHEALRTTFVAEAGQPFQVIAPPAEWKLSVVDARDVELDRREARALDLVMQEVRRPFDLERGPLFRVRLLRLGDDDAILSAVIHHAILDEASIAILTRELGQLYRACRAGQAAVLPDLPVQYADYAAWQHEVLGSGALDRELAYWKAQLEGAPDLLSLPTDAPRPPFAGTEGATCSVVIDAQLHDRLKALAASTQTTTFMILLAAWATLLHRYSGQSRVVVGVPVAGRGRSEIENVIGFFINTLALPVDLSGDPSFRELLERVRTTSVGGLDHRDFPFDRLVHEISPGQSLRHHPIFQAMFALQTDAAAKLELDGVDATSIRFSNETAFVDLLLHVLLGEREIVARLTYRVDLFRESTVRRMAAHFRHLLAAVSRDPEMRSSEVPLLDEGERRHVVSELAGVSVAGGADSPLTAQALFERQAAQTPSATAVVFEGRALTYAELDARANRLAHRLARAGVGPESVVGICLRRGIDMVVAVLGVLKAGGAYVPLDPDYPPDRLRVMLEDSGAAAVLGGAASLPGGVPSLLVDEGEDAPAEASDRPPGVPVAADSVAYVIYTSGSSGRPKGVAMTHGALVNMLVAQRTQSRAGQPLRTLQYASLSFDVSFQEMFSTWMVGGTLVLVENSIRRDPFALLAFMEAQRIQRLFVPFAALSSLAEAAADGDVGSALVEIVTAGEQLQLTPGVRRWLRAIGPASLYNQYGPSETHLATSFAVRDDEGTPLPPIGRPIANARVYVLDGSLRPAPVGVPGECFIGGLAPGRGYWRRPELTAERFLPDPFGLPGSRMYRTGDRVRWLENGNLEFLG